MNRACTACGYDASDSKGVLCVWCWENMIADNAALLLGDRVQLSADVEMAALVADFIRRADRR